MSPQDRIIKALGDIWMIAFPDREPDGRPVVCSVCHGIEGDGFETFTINELTQQIVHQSCEINRRIHLVLTGYRYGVFDQDREA